jgi:hypothetical protein
MKKNIASKRSKIQANRKIRRKRVHRAGVRNSILTSLATGAFTREQLRSRGGFSAAALDAHLRQLRLEGTVVATGKRPLLFALSAGQHRDPARLSPGSGLSPELKEALDAVNRRFFSTDKLQEKLATLEQLAATLPMPIASVLQDIRSDYLAMVR